VAADECVGRVVCVCVQEIRSVSMETSPFSPLTENKNKIKIKKRKTSRRTEILFNFSNFAFYQN
jgi:hypothetical protein